MKKILKRILKIIICILIVIAVLLLIAFVYHRIMLKIENKYTGIENAPGILVDVNGHKMHVYTEGQGDKILVFMAGFGSTCPYIEFKPLYEKLSDKYRIVVVERAGYGYSEDTDVSRDMDTILDETRIALQLANITGKYILVPHSMSGIEAIYWVNKYPEEIEGICAIDISTCGYYQEAEKYNNMISNWESINKSSVIATKIGLHRLPFVYSALNKNGITNEEWKIQKAMFFKNASCNAVVNEGINIYSNSLVVDEDNISKEIPIITFISSQMQEVYMSNANINWQEILEKFTSKFENGKTVFVESSHMIHTDKPEFIAEKIVEFLENK